MKYLVISKHSERREEMKSLLRQLDRRAQMQDARDWIQAESALDREPRDLVFADLAGATAHREASAMLLRRPEVVLAALSDEGDAQQAVDLLRAGLRAVIPRDLDWRAVVRALELVLLGGYYVPAYALRLGASSFGPGGGGATAMVGERVIPYRRRLIDPTTLSPRQQQIMRLVHMGSTNKGIARALGISEGTVKIHLATVFKMLGASNRAAAVAIYNGWLFDQVQGTRGEPLPSGEGTLTFTTEAALAAPPFGERHLSLVAPVVEAVIETGAQPVAQPAIQPMTQPVPQPVIASGTVPAEHGVPPSDARIAARNTASGHAAALRAAGRHRAALERPAALMAAEHPLPFGRERSRADPASPDADRVDADGPRHHRVGPVDDGSPDPTVES